MTILPLNQMLPDLSNWLSNWFIWSWHHVSLIGLVLHQIACMVCFPRKLQGTCRGHLKPCVPAEMWILFYTSIYHALLYCWLDSPLVCVWVCEINCLICNHYTWRNHINTKHNDWVASSVSSWPCWLFCFLMISTNTSRHVATLLSNGKPTLLHPAWWVKCPWFTWWATWSLFSGWSIHFCNGILSILLVGILFFPSISMH